MNNEALKNKYFVKRRATDPWSDVEILFSGVHILGLSGMNDLGEAINVYKEQWMDGRTDFKITSSDGVIRRKNVTLKMTYIVGRRYYVMPMEEEEVDLETDLFKPLLYTTGDGYRITEAGEYTFYDYGGTQTATYTLDVDDMLLCTDNTMPTFAVRRKDFDESTVEESFKKFMTDKDVWIRSAYFGKQAHVVCHADVSLETVKLHRGTTSRIMGVLPLECLDPPTRY